MTSPLCNPLYRGWNFTLNVSDCPGEMLDANGSLPTEKPYGKDRPLIVRFAVPVLVTLNVCVTEVFSGTVPKSVPSVLFGTVLPSGILV